MDNAEAYVSYRHMPTRLNIENFNREPVNITFENIKYKVTNRKNKEEKNILDNISGAFYAGKLAAIIGPSGAGKTSLLNILAGNKKKNVSGQILINGENRNLDEFQWQSSYIAQESSLLPALTINETLSIAIELKLSETLNQKEKLEFISEICNLLGLKKVLNTRVSNLSGGEIKRLFIGVELVTNPPVMFFDEPTSGLDSVSSCQVISHLKTLAKNGHTVICVIHQPSSRLFNMFDDVLVVSNGKSVYGGSINDMVGAFESGGFTCPEYYNRADFALEIASAELSDTSSISNTLEEISDEKASDTFTQTLSSPSLYQTVPVDEIDESSNSNKIAFRKSSKKKYAVSQLKQFWILLKRSILCTFRDLQMAKMRVSAHLIVGVILGLLYYDIGNDAAKIMSNASLMFFLILFVFYANAMSTVLTFPQEAAVFQREHQNNWYSLTAYFFSKLMADIPLQILCPTLFVMTLYYMSGQPMESDRFIMVWAICILFAIVAQTFGLVIGVAMNDKMGIFFSQASTIPMLLFSGFFLRLNEIPNYLRPLSYISHFRFGFESILLAIYDYGRKPLDCSVAYCYLKLPTKFLDEMNVEPGNYFKNFFILVGFIIFLQILLFCILKYRVWKCQQ